MELTDQQRRQVDAIASLLIQPDRGSITQGVELAAALDDQAIFAALLDGASAQESASGRPRHRRYPTVRRADLFEGETGEQAWLDLAMIHLLAASDLPLRTEVTSLAVGARLNRHAKLSPTLWLDGLERFTSLTHLDIQLKALDQGIDLSPLGKCPKLTHLRIRGGAAQPGPLPTLEHLEEFDGVNIEFGVDSAFPSLRTLRAQIANQETLTATRFPSLVSIEAKAGLRLEGFESMEKLWCSHGVVEVPGLRRVGHLRVIRASFDAPDLRHVGKLDRATPDVDISQFETLDEVAMSRTSRFAGGVFPKGTRLIDPKVILWGPAMTDLGNIGELAGMEVLSMPRVKAPISLETLRHAKDLRVLDIRNSPGITDLSPLVGLPKLEVLVINDPDRLNMPPELAELVQQFWRPGRRVETAKPEVNEKA